jgi:class 3 adenylate cyclase
MSVVPPREAAFPDGGAIPAPAPALPEAPLRVHIGLHTGSPARDEDNFYGTDVNLAARIADHVAQAGQIVISGRLHGLLRQQEGFAFGAAIEVELKGLSAKQSVFEVIWT